MKQISLLRRLCVLVVLFGISALSAMANNNKDYYSKVNLTATGNGKVYVSYKEPKESPVYNETVTAESGKDSQSDAPTHTYYLYAQPADQNYVLEGWYKNEACSETELYSRLNNTKFSITADQDVNKATQTFWAKFRAFSTATGNDPLNITSLIVNPDFEDSTWDTGWTVNGFGNQSGNVNFTGTFAQIWDQDATKVMSGSIEQTINNLPAGSYKLSAKAVCGVNGKDYIYAKVGDKVNEFVLPVTNVGTAREYSVSFTIEEGQSVTIGFARENSQNWSAVDDFSLIYYGNEKMEEALLSIKSGKYGTFVAPFDVVLPEEVTAYEVLTTGDFAFLKVLKNGGETLPAGNPVIVYATDAISKTFVGKASEEETIEANGLVGFYQEGSDVPVGAYVLQTQNSEQGFYKVQNTTVNGKKNRCYIPASSEAGARLSIVLNDDKETAVEAVATEATVAEIYSLKGTKLAAPQKGINIVKMTDGSVKKVMVK